MAEKGPRLVVLSSLFPSAVRPGTGLFIRERMFRVGRILPIVVVSPQPWFPLQGLIRRIRPNFRPPAPRAETQDGITVLRPRFVSFPGVFRSLDGWLMAVGCYWTLRRLRAEFDFELIDAHFAYPEGYAGVLLGRWLKVPVTVTLRGTEVPFSRHPIRRRRILDAVARAARVFSVSNSLLRHVAALGADAGKFRVVGNGVDVQRFYLEDRRVARERLNLAEDANVLISVGPLVERKGFHRVIECIPELLRRWPKLRFLIVGGGSPEGDVRPSLERQVEELGLQDVVLFLGLVPPHELRWPLSAADVFVLATRNEGWANVLLEAMACGLPVVATDVGGNAEVICRSELGELVPFGDRIALTKALSRALGREWNREAIIRYAQENAWEDRVGTLVEEFTRLAETARESDLKPAPGVS
jgi:glycosyltransferase involved in cell wall biosynthesis